ncbi:hypothetical protein [Paraburkholderia aromaticivorans]
MLKHAQAAGAQLRCPFPLYRLSHTELVLQADSTLTLFVGVGLR